MERPFFTVSAPHPTVPLLLSEPGIEPVTQVRINCVLFCLLCMLFVFQWKENASRKHDINIQWESFRGGKVYQYPLQCKRQRVKAQRWGGGGPLLPLTGMCRLTGSGFLTVSLKKSMLVWLINPLPLPALGWGRGEGDSRVLIHVRNSASMWRSWHHVTTYIPYKTRLLETEHYTKCPVSDKSETLEQTWYYWGVPTERNRDN